ncbi:sensor histidine kinase [Aurantivibrio plasticivorans]
MLSSTPNNLQDIIRSEQVKGIYEQAVMASLNSWGIGLFILFIPNPAVSFGQTLLWFMALSIASSIRLLLWWRFSHSDIPLSEYPKWGVGYAIVVASVALIWGSSLFVLTDPNHLAYEAVFMIVIVAMCIGAAHASTTYPLLGQAYYIPAMGCVFINCFILQGAIFYALAFMSIVFVGMMFVVGRDSHKRFEEMLRLRLELAEQKDEAERANIAKSKFLAAASHDLRQPLHALALFTGVLKTKVSEPDSIKTVDNIDRSVNALQGLFNGLLDISKLDAGTLTPEFSNVSMRQILQPIYNECALEASAKNINLHIDMPDTIVHTDPDLLSRILRNLLSNAVRYTDVGAVTVRCASEGNNVLLSIQDTGAGIPAESQDIIFDEFVQLHNPERDRNKGLGLGLAIVKRLVDMLGYELTLESTPGRGTCFSLSIPLGEQLPTHNPSIAELSQRMSPLKGIRVMIVDDEETIREGAESLLASWGCEANAFSDADSALGYLASGGQAPDIILADYRLQNDKTGVQAINDIVRIIGSPIPAAIITGDTAPDRIREAESSGYLLLHKPLQPMQLRAYLTRTVQQLKNEAGAN